MKPLTEMTPSEAIAYTVGKVPEIQVPSIKARLEPEWDSPDDGPSIVIDNGAAAAEALFFSAAWEWLKNQPGTYDLCPMHGAWGVFNADTSRGLGVPALYPTKTLALCAAVLIAKGEVVP